MENLITAKEAAELLNVKKNTLFVWVRTKKGNIPALRTGSHIKFLPSELLQWARDQQEKYQKKQTDKEVKDGGKSK